MNEAATSGLDLASSCFHGDRREFSAESGRVAFAMPSRNSQRHRLHSPSHAACARKTEAIHVWPPIPFEQNRLDPIEVGRNHVSGTYRVLFILE